MDYIYFVGLCRDQNDAGLNKMLLQMIIMSTTTSGAGRTEGQGAVFRKALNNGLKGHFFGLKGDFFALKGHSLD